MIIELIKLKLKAFISLFPFEKKKIIATTRLLDTQFIHAPATKR